MKINFLLLFALMSLLVITNIQAVNVDIYQYMGSGNDGDLLTSEIMSASSYGGINGLPVPDYELIARDSTNSYRGVWVSSDYARQLPGKVTVKGIDYSGLGGHTWSVYHKWMTNFVDCKFGKDRLYNHTPYHDSMTVACFFTPGTWFPSSSMFLDMIILSGTVTQNGGASQYNYAVLSLQNGASETTVNVSVHTEKGSGARISLISGHTYWVNLQFNGPAGKGRLAVFNPDDNWNQVGETSELDLQAVSNPLDSKVRSRVKFGRCDTHANYTSDSNPQTYFSHLMIDYTEGKFPFLPDSASVNISCHKNNPATPQMKIIPDSFTGKITIQLSNGSKSQFTDTELQIFDLSGGLIDKVTLSGGKYLWSNSTLSNGAYIMRVEGPWGRLNQKILLTR